MKHTRRTRSQIARATAGAGVAAGLVVLSLTSAGAAVAAKASGTIKIHGVGTADTDNSNEPKVCAFTIVGDGFDAAESLTYSIVLGAPFKSDPVLTGSVVANATGSWSSDVINLPDGHYKATVLDGETNKEKVFKVECPGSTDPGTTDPGTTDPGTTDPGTTDPGTTDPGTTDPGTTDPGTSGDPGTTDPGTTDPGTTDPGTDPDPTVDTVVTPGTPVGDGDGTGSGAPAEETDDQVAEEDDAVEGTFEEHPEALPATGASGAASFGVAGLLLVGAGLGLRRAVRQSD